MIRLQALAHAASAEPTLQRLTHLCLVSPDLRFIGAIISFISTKECADILSQWAEDSNHARGLDRLVRACWADGLLVERLRPFGPDQLVEVRFRTHLKEQYLACMAAARQALPVDQTSIWLQRLRVYILVRALDALDASAMRESHLLEICTTVRKVCDSTTERKRGWIERLVGKARGYFEFEAETTIRCRAALESCDPKSGRDFYRALLSILDGGQWIALPVNAYTPAIPLFDPYPFDAGERSLLTMVAALDSQASGAAASLGDVDQNGSNIARQRTDSTQSPAVRKARGEGLRLENVEQALFLPHSWHQLSLIEESLLFARVLQLLNSDELADRFGAAATWIALLASTTMHDTGKLLLGSEPTSDWHLDLDSSQLLRNSPRFARRWRAESLNSVAPQWIHPLGGPWVYKLDPVLCNPLKDALAIAPGMGTLGELWARIGTERTLATWFNTHFTDFEGLSRLTAPSVANVVSMRVFETTGDHALARLIGSDHRTALPAACAYGAYRGSETFVALKRHIGADLAALVAPIDDDNINWCGSELDVRLPLLRGAMEDLARRVDVAAATATWIEHHNLLTALTTISLLSSTGARPVNSPFQSLAWIDIDRALLYVEDKTAGPTQGSRICVLSNFAFELLRCQYLPHLGRMADAVRGDAPTFAAELDKVLSGNPEAALPLLFFVRSNPTFDWTEVSESQLDVVCDFGWSLPWNLFRHLTSTWLRRWGLHPDIRDALLGHADRDAESHGDYSVRVPAEDLEIARPLINRLQTEIGFVLPQTKVFPLISATGIDQSLVHSGRSFGRKARAERRDVNLQAAKERANQEIQSTLRARSVEELSPEELDGIARKMLMRPDGIPHAMGSIRYSVFESFLESEWRSHGRQAKLRHRYVLMPEGRPLFTEDFVGADRQLLNFSVAFESIVAGVLNRVERPVMAAALAAIDLVLSSNIAHFKGLCSLLCNHSSIQLVRFDSRYWFEWGYGANWQDGKPVFRVEITGRAACWISLARSGKSWSKVPALPTALAPLALILGTGAVDLGGLIKHLTTLRAQSNAFRMPGVLAAHLAARRPAAALPHADWMRVISRVAPLKTDGFVGATQPDADGSDEEAEYFFRNHHKPVTGTTGSALERCQSLFTEIRKTLNSGKSNREIAAQVAKEVKKSGFARGDAPFTLAHFTAHLLRRKPKRGTRDRLRTATALRYWYSLAPPFLEAASGANLLDMEDDELTDLYTSIVEAWSTADAERSVKGRTKVPPEGSTLAMGEEADAREEPGASKDVGTSDAPVRTLIQLREFHDFARATYGLQDPDWSEISPEITVGVGRPGLLLVNEYLAVLAMQLDGKAVDDADDHSLSKAFVLVVCARFGVRIGEAVGMNRSDWLDRSGAVILLVRGNWTRPLKTTQSRRQVPLIESLTDLEQKVVSRVLMRWLNREGENQNSPLLAQISRDTFKSTKNSISSGLLQDIKAVTRHEGSTVHMLRHGFAMRVLSALLGLQLDPSAVTTPELTDNARRLLLGRIITDRRTLWAVARLLGHSSPAMTLRSYVNCLHLWLAPVSNNAIPEGSPPPDKLIDLDAIKIDPSYLDAIRPHVVIQAALVEPLFLRYMRFLRFMGIGQTELSASANAKLTVGEAQALGSALNKATTPLAPDAKRYAGFKLLDAITTTRMNALLVIAEGAREFSSHPRELSDWISTVGSSRQILLFDSIQFECFSAFVKTLDLNMDDVWLVSRPRLHPSLVADVQVSGLGNYVHNRSEMGASFQLDVARFGIRPRVAPERVAAIVRESGKLRSGFELLLLWTVWNCTATTTKPPAIS